MVWLVWADVLPNLLIGLREGLESGLVVSILLAAVRKATTDGDGRPAGGGSTGPIWLGVVAAVVLAFSFGAVLTFYRSVLSTTAQESLGGALSVVAVVLVTWMVFWMRRSARTLSGDLRARVADAMTVGPLGLAMVAFLAVAREGVETALFVWTVAAASGQTLAPLVGAGVGVAAAVLVCVLLYRSIVRFRVGTFFNRTAALLVVIAAGVFAYGLGDLQDAGVLPGHTWVAFDLSRHLDPSSAWVTVVTGITNLRPTMTWLQVAGYVAYLGGVLVALSRAGTAAVPAPVAVPPPIAVPPPVAVPARPARRRTAALTAALTVPPLVAVGLIAFAPGQSHSGEQVEVTATTCAPSFTAHAGRQSFTVANRSTHAVEVTLIQAASQGIVAEVETLGPATSQGVSVSLGSGGYFWRCLADGLPTLTSATVQVSGGAGQSSQVVVKPVSVADLQPAVDAYQAYVKPKLTALAGQVAHLRADTAAGNLAAARADWLAAQLTWDQVGAAYGSFDELGAAIDGLPQAQPRGVDDPDFTGLHRVEFGLWHGQKPAQLLPVVDKLAADIAELQRKLPQVTIDPTDMPLRAHEILEDALRDQLTGQSDEGSGTAYPQTLAGVQGTRVVLDELAPLLDARDKTLLPAARAQLSAVEQALAATRAGGPWRSPADTPLAAREAVDATIGAALETLSRVPTLLEVPAH
jgi:high-affinity iron transporter